MILNSLLRGLLVFAALCSLPVFAGAATIQVKVVEVESGNTIVVNSINRPLKIKLKAVAPPEGSQPFSDAAREHLKALVLDKIVVVEYTHLADGYLFAKVTSDGVDVGSQMLRDGFAWYERANDHALRDSDRDLYAQYEQTARNQKLGLWQDPSPVAPWDFRQAQLDRLNGIVSSPSFRQSQSRAKGKQSGFSSNDLLSTMAGPGSIAGQPNSKRISANGTPGRWTRYESNFDHYSVLFPSDGVEGTYSTFDTAGNAIPFHYLSASNEQAAYLLMSAKGPDSKYTDALAIDETVKAFLGGLNHSFERRGLNLVTLKPLRDLKLNGYAGKQYILRGEGFSGVVRAYSKQTGDQREFFMLCVLTRTGSEFAGDQFLNSFKINQ